MKASAANRAGRVLTALILLEFALFSGIGRNFLSAANAVEMIRAGAEGGLLALALTPVIITGGIDLSVGSLVGLSAVALGSLWRDAGWPIAAAASAALAIGVAGGALNALLIARVGVAPLIVTLGTYSLFRGLAEALTEGVQNYSNFPPGFLFLGQGTISGAPVQLFVLVAAGLGYWLLLHRMAAGRALRAIGFSPDGARYAGIAVGARVALVYVLSGLCAGVAALLYASRVGQAKADAGTGLELFALTAVVLGGTSIFGGRGSIAGTSLGLAAIVLLQQGLRLADLPSELAGVSIAFVLLAAIAADRVITREDRV